MTVPFWSMPENTDHPTQKPEKLLAKIILASCPPDGVVLDPFLGSGTTSVVAKKLGRSYVGIEQDADYCCLAEKRLALAEHDRTIQGYADGVFWERNSAPAVRRARAIPRSGRRAASIRLPSEGEITMSKSRIFDPQEHRRIEKAVVEMLNSQPDFLSSRTAESTRAVGDAIQSILSEHFQSLLGEHCAEYSAQFARRAMADLAFKDCDGFYHVDFQRQERMSES